MNKIDEYMSGLLSLQEALDRGEIANYLELRLGYKMIYDEPDGGKRFWYPKIVNGKVQVLATFRLETQFNGIDRYSINYSVREDSRGKGLAVEAVNLGVDDLKQRLNRFYIEAIIDKTNSSSIKVAIKLFSSPGETIIDDVSGKPSLLFCRLVE